jgi:hypothetical protein
MIINNILKNRNNFDTVLIDIGAYSNIIAEKLMKLNINICIVDITKFI